MPNPKYLSDDTGLTQPLATLSTPGSITAQYSSADQALGTLTWAGTTAPNGVSSSYIVSMSGKVATIVWKIKATGAGLLVTSVTCPLPADCPAPYQFSDQANDDWVQFGSGAILANSSDSPGPAAKCGIYKSASGLLQLKILSGTASLAAKVARGTVTYVTAG